MPHIDERLEQTEFLEAGVAVMPDDDMVQHLDAEQRPGGGEPSRQLDVVAARRRIAAGMHVSEHHRGRIRQKGDFEDLARLCCSRSYVAPTPGGQR